MSHVWPWNLTFPVDQTDPSHHVLLTFHFTEQYWQVVGKEQIWGMSVRHPLKTLLSFGGTRNCSAHSSSYRKALRGHVPFLLFPVHHFCAGQIFSRALTAELKGELLGRAHRSFSFEPPLGDTRQTVCSAKTYHHSIAETFTSSLPYT